MINLFISIGVFDIIDIFVVAFLLYQVYQLIRGTVAINIFIGIFLVYILWQMVSAFKMDLLNTIIGQFMGVGVIALIVVFQQEIRRFLLLLGTREFFNKSFSFDTLLNKHTVRIRPEHVESIVYACSNMAATKTGALIVISTYGQLHSITASGDMINADLSTRLLENIFFKNSPLHDGAVVIRDTKIIAARCILPLTKSTAVPASMGMRHRAAIGITETTNVFVIVVSEETGNISVFKSEQEFIDINAALLKSLLIEYLNIDPKA
ncbi:MAG: diadenylate cyclase CdaA [Salinivirgaceae bacterium]|nr:diadenylate cyclase CdaA [Salinivirgaceae bacterium]MDY0281081.1 diadenylate cyclase CdaA [Salinivirgaceae bacterium]